MRVMRIDVFHNGGLQALYPRGMSSKPQVDETRDTQSRKLDIILIMVHFEEEEGVHR